MSNTNPTVDVLVVGSGAAALTAALSAADAGQSVLVVESTTHIGGSTAMSGGGAWLPNNPIMKEAGVTDSYEQARTYMDAVIRVGAPASTPERRDAFVRTSPTLVSWLRDLGFEWVYGKGYSDYHPEEPGGMAIGRAVEGAAWNVKKLSPADRALIRAGVPIPMHTLRWERSCALLCPQRVRKGRTDHWCSNHRWTSRRPTTDDVRPIHDWPTLTPCPPKTSPSGLTRHSSPSQRTAAGSPGRASTNKDGE